MINWANFVSQLINGLALGALLALISSGLTIIYGTLGVLNLAHGAMFMLGGYAGFMAWQATGSFVAAGTTVTKPVPSDAIAVSTGRQKNLEGWGKRRRAGKAEREDPK